MKLTGKAEEIRDKFTDNLELTLNESDPEFVEIFDNFLFDEHTRNRNCLIEASI